jgi:hypothetical protein
MRRLAGLALFVCALLPCTAGTARAETSSMVVCFDYGCRAQQEVRFDDATFDAIEETLQTATDARSERFAIAAAVARLYVEAGKQTPIWRDRGGDAADDGEGSMDCIDHAFNTTGFMKLLEARGLLRFHAVNAPIRRGFFAEHWAGMITELSSGANFTVDSWYYDFGMPAVIMALPDWKDGLRPPGIMAGFR